MPESLIDAIAGMEGLGGGGAAPAPSRPDSLLDQIANREGLSSAPPTDYFATIERLAKARGLTMSSGYRTPAHNAAVGGAPHSFHTRKDGSGHSLGTDWGGDPAAMAAFAGDLERELGPHLAELFYDPTNTAWKRGKRLGKPIGNHSDHVHVAYPVQAPTRAQASVGPKRGAVPSLPPVSSSIASASTGADLLRQAGQVASIPGEVFPTPTPPETTRALAKRVKAQGLPDTRPSRERVQGPNVVDPTNLQVIRPKAPAQEAAEFVGGFFPPTAAALGEERTLQQRVRGQAEAGQAPPPVMLDPPGTRRRMAQDAILERTRPVLERYYNQVQNDYLQRVAAIRKRAQDTKSLPGDTSGRVARQDEIERAVRDAAARLRQAALQRLEPTTVLAHLKQAGLPSTGDFTQSLIPSWARAQQTRLAGAVEGLRREAAESAVGLGLMAVAPTAGKVTGGLVKRGAGALLQRIPSAAGEAITAAAQSRAGQVAGELAEKGHEIGLFGGGQAAANTAIQGHPEEAAGAAAQGYAGGFALGAGTALIGEALAPFLARFKAGERAQVQIEGFPGEYTVVDATPKAVTAVDGTGKRVKVAPKLVRVQAVEGANRSVVAHGRQGPTPTPVDAPPVRARPDYELPHPERVEVPGAPPSNPNEALPQRSISPTSPAPEAKPWLMTREEYGKSLPQVEGPIAGTGDFSPGFRRVLDEVFPLPPEALSFGEMTPDELRRSWQGAHRAGSLRAVAEARDAGARSWEDAAHYALIKRALAEGKPVPPKVLAEYPSLHAGAQVPTPPTPTPEPPPASFFTANGRLKGFSREQGGDLTDFHALVTGEPDLAGHRTLGELHDAIGPDRFRALEDLHENSALHPALDHALELRRKELAGTLETVERESAREESAAGVSGRGYAQEMLSAGARKERDGFRYVTLDSLQRGVNHQEADLAGRERVYAELQRWRPTPEDRLFPDPGGRGSMTLRELVVDQGVVPGELADGLLALGKRRAKGDPLVPTQRITSEQQLASALELHFGIARPRARATAAIAQARAEAWGEATNQPPREWYVRHLAEIGTEPGVKGGPKASVTFDKEGRAIIRALQKPNVSSAVHELAHVFRRDLSATLGAAHADIQTMEQWAGAEGGVWSTAAEEKFARGFERYLRDGLAPNEGLARVFARFKEWLGKIYRVVTEGHDLDVRITPEMRGVYDRMLGGEGKGKAERVAIDLDARESDLLKAWGKPEGQRTLFQRQQERHAGETREAGGIRVTRGRERVTVHPDGVEVEVPHEIRAGNQSGEIVLVHKGSGDAFVEWRGDGRLGKTVFAPERFPKVFQSLRALNPELNVRSEHLDLPQAFGATDGVVPPGPRHYLERGFSEVPIKSLEGALDDDSVMLSPDGRFLRSPVISRYDNNAPKIGHHLGGEPQSQYRSMLRSGYAEVYRSSHLDENGKRTQVYTVMLDAHGPKHLSDGQWAQVDDLSENGNFPVRLYNPNTGNYVPWEEAAQRMRATIGEAKKYTEEARRSGRLDERSKFAPEPWWKLDMSVEGRSLYQKDKRLTPEEKRRQIAVDFGAVQLGKGLTDRAAWDERMISSLGEGVRPHLDALWKESQRHYRREYADAIAPPSGPEAPAPTRKPSRPPVSPTATGLANQVQERELHLIAPPEKGVTHDAVEAARVGGKEVRSGRADPVLLAQQIADEQRPFTWKEAGALLEGKRRLVNAVNAARERLDKAEGSAVASAQAEYEQAKVALQSFTDNVQKGKTEWHNTGVALQAGVELDTGNFAEVIAEVDRVRKGSATPLPAKEEAALRAESRAVAEARQKLADAELALERERAAHTQTQRDVEVAQRRNEDLRARAVVKEARGAEGDPESPRARTSTSPRQARETALSRLDALLGRSGTEVKVGATLEQRPSRTLHQNAPAPTAYDSATHEGLAGVVARSFAQEGADAEAAYTATIAAFRERGVEVTREQIVRDLAAKGRDAGKAVEPAAVSRAEAAQRVRDLVAAAKREAELTAQIERVRAGLAAVEGEGEPAKARVLSGRLKALTEERDALLKEHGVTLSGEPRKAGARGSRVPMTDTEKIANEAAKRAAYEAGTPSPTRPRVQPSEPVRTAQAATREARSHYGWEEKIRKAKEALATGDFSGREARQTAAASARVQDARARYALLDRRIRARIESAKPKTTQQQALAVAQGAADTIRGITLGSDVGVLTRQGLFAWSRPGIATEAVGQALKAARSDVDLMKWQLAREQQQINGQSVLVAQKKAGLSVTDPLLHSEELIVAKVLKKIPKLGNAVGALERFQTVFINDVRDRAFNQALRQGFTPEELKLRAHFINSATGRGNVKDVHPYLQLILTSPRYEASRWEMLAAPLKNVVALGSGGRPNRAAAANLQDMVVTTTGIVGLFKLAELAGYHVTWNPLSSDFLKMRRGEDVWDVSAGMAPRLRDLIRLYVVATHPDYKQNIGDVLKGTVVRTISPGVRLPVEQGSYAFQRAEGKSPKSPITGFGDDPDRQGWVTLFPLIFQSMREAWKKDGAAGGAWAGAREFVGSSVNRYPAKQAPPMPSLTPRKN